MMTFNSLSVYGWRQYDEIEINFHPHLTVFTGSNGAGKTTLLNILSQHFGWNSSFISTPKRGFRGVIRYVADIKRNRRTKFNTLQNLPQIGNLSYSNGASSELRVPEDTSASSQYQIWFSNQQPVNGIFVSSHRPLYFYQPVTSIPTQVNAKDQLLNQYLNELKNRYVVNARNPSASFRIKEALISLAALGYGNEAVARNDDAIKTFEGFQEILRLVLPKSLGFKRLHVELPEVVLRTASGDFSFDAVSGGIAAIIDLSWQVYMASLNYENFVTVIDEPENHLHPELQREMLPNFIEAFPRSQFVIASHNPFMVTSVPDSHVYALRYIKAQIEEDRESVDREVRSFLLDTVNKAGTSNEVLREVLGVPITMPLWAEARIDEIVNKHAQLNLDEGNLREMLAELSQLGLEHLFPDAVSRVIEGR